MIKVRGRVAVGQFAAVMALVALSAAACGSAGGSGARSPEGAPSAADWAAHCEAVAKRGASCQFGDDVVTANALAICKKTERCVVATYRADAVAPILACEESGDCDDACLEVVGEKLTPFATETSTVATCNTKFAGCEGACNSFVKTMRTAPESDWSGLAKCIDKAKSCGEAMLCGAAGAGAQLQAVMCVLGAAPTEAQENMTLVNRPYADRPKIDGFGKNFAVDLGGSLPSSPVPVPSKSAAKPVKPAKRPAAKAQADTPPPPVDPRTWKYNELALDVSYDPMTGPVQAIRFEYPGATQEQCKALAKKLVEDWGPPSRNTEMMGMRQRVWKGEKSILKFGWAFNSCKGTFAVKGGETWNQVIERH